MFAGSRQQSQLVASEKLSRWYWTGSLQLAACVAVIPIITCCPLQLVILFMWYRIVLFLSRFFSKRFLLHWKWNGPLQTVISWWWCWKSKFINYIRVISNGSAICMQATWCFLPPLLMQLLFYNFTICWVGDLALGVEAIHKTKYDAKSCWLSRLCSIWKSN